MNGRQAIKALEEKGYHIVRRGRGSHVILQNGPHRIVVPDGNELSQGMARKVKCFLKKTAQSTPL